MIKTGDYVFLKCLVTSVMPMGSVRTSDYPIEPDVVGVIPVDCDDKIMKRFKPISLLVEDVIPIDKTI